MAAYRLYDASHTAAAVPANKTLHLTPVNMAKNHDGNRLFRWENPYVHRGAQVS